MDKHTFKTIYIFSFPYIIFNNTSKITILKDISPTRSVEVYDVENKRNLFANDLTAFFVISNHKPH